MTTTAAAIYENGVLRPLTPLPLAEGARVEVTVTDAPAGPPAAQDRQSFLDAMEKIAALPMQSEQDGFSGEDHDRVLYPETGKMP